MLNRRNLLAAGLVLPMASQTASAEPPHLTSPLIGTWSLIDAITVQKDGRSGPWENLPRPYQGLIIYEPNGLMSVQIACARSPLPQGGDFMKVSVDERLEYLRTYYAYYGRYEFDRAQSTVSHFVTTSLDPTEVGIVYHRKVMIAGGVLTLTTPPISKSEYYNVLTWRRPR